MTKLSVNINKIATLRNARGGMVPNLVEAALNCERFGAQGITVHPRPDERHIRYQDVYDLKDVLSTEFNIEGYPSEDFIQLVLEANPAQVTLVPDPPGVLTSNAGWDAIKQLEFLKPIISRFKNAGIRVSVFMDCDLNQIEAISKSGTDRIELYTEAYASQYQENRESAVAPYTLAAQAALDLGMKVNAGHDLNQENLGYFVAKVPQVEEVSIGHALISEALYEGLENTIQRYLRVIEMSS